MPQKQLSCIYTIQHVHVNSTETWGYKVCAVLTKLQQLEKQQQQKHNNIIIQQIISNMALFKRLHIVGTDIKLKHHYIYIQTQSMDTFKGIENSYFPCT